MDFFDKWLLVANNPPTITLQPQDATGCVGSSASFSVAASGATPLYYQWLYNSNNLANATNDTLILTNIQRADAGAYAVSISNIFGVATSSNAWLVVTAAPPLVEPDEELIELTVGVGPGAT